MMKHTQQNPNFCYSKDEFKKFVRGSNNSRYKYFHQNHYTAGDHQQFLESWGNFPYNKNRNLEIIQTNKKPNLLLHDVTSCDFCVHDIFNTFQYIHEKFKKGCFLQIFNNKVETFQPFSKQNYRNEWGNLVKIDPKFKGDVVEMMKCLSTYDKTCTSFDKNKIHRDVYAWYGNNGLFRFEFPLSESDNGYNILHDMFLTLERERVLPDVEFFLNKRDFPILKKNRTEAYDCIFGKNHKLVSHSYAKYVPILSMNTSEEYDDIAIPTWEDWRMVSYLHDQKLFPKDFYTYEHPDRFDEIEWSSKIPTAVWRGSSTGRGTTVSNNIRLFFYNYSKKQCRDTDGELFVNVEITKWNLRPRKHPDEKYMTVLYEDDFDFKVGEYMTPLQQARYKYILHLPGHSCAYRLTYELSSGSVVLLYPSEFHLWFFPLLVPWEHYVPLENTFDETEIESKIRWCKENDERCQQITKNAREFAKTVLSREGILDYLQNLFCHLGSIQNDGFQHQSVHTYQVSYGERKINEYLRSWNEISSEFYKTGVWFTDPSYVSYFFFNVGFLKLPQLEGFLEKHRTQSDFVVSKKTSLHLYEYNEFKWVEKVCQESRIHEIVLGYYFVNRLAQQYPYFMSTYYHILKSNQTRLFLEYIPGNTLDKEIRNENITLDNLIHIWIQLSMALETAQDFCGFVHMDTCPWNIIIQRKKNCVYFPKYEVETNFDIVPVLIDYGNSHVSDRGFHFYDTTPFYLNSMIDVVCMIITSLDIFLSKVTLNNKDKHRIFTIMEYFHSVFLDPLPSFDSIHHIKVFLKQQKNFSNILCMGNRLKQKSPMDFVQFMLKRNMVDSFHFQWNKKKQTHIHSLHYPAVYRSFYDELRIFNQLQIHEHMIPNDICILYRKLFTKFKTMLKGLYFESEEQKGYNHFIIHDFILQYERTLYQLEMKLDRKVWMNHSFSMFRNFLDDYKLDESIIKKSEIYCQESKSEEVRIPVLKFHVCRKCEECKKSVEKEFFDHLSCIYLFRPKTDCFLLQNQIS